MKAILHAAALLTFFTFAGCSGGAGKFTGKWREVNGGERAQVLMIEKKGEAYDVYHEKDPSDFRSFKYDADHDILTIEKGDEAMDIRYDKSTKHLKVGQRGGRDVLELEKI